SHQPAKIRRWSLFHSLSGRLAELANKFRRRRRSLQPLHQHSRNQSRGLVFRWALVLRQLSGINVRQLLCSTSRKPEALGRCHLREQSQTSSNGGKRCSFE